MSEHKNVSGVDLDLHVDGRPYFAAVGETVTIPDEFDYQLEQQPAWELVGGSVPVPVPPVEETPAAPEPIVTDVASASEGDN